MAQNTCGDPRRCLLIVTILSDHVQGVISPKNSPKTPPDAEIPAKIYISEFHCNFWTAEPILIKKNLRVASMKYKTAIPSDFSFFEIQDGVGRHLEYQYFAITFEPFDRFLSNLKRRLLEVICNNGYGIEPHPTWRSKMATTAAILNFLILL